MSLLSELKRRNVIRVALGYLAAAWLLIQIVETLFPVFGLSDVAIRTVVIVLAAGFIPALIGTWVFEWTPSGIVRDDGERDTDDATRQRRFDRAVMAVLALAVAYFTVDKFVLDPARDLEREAEVARQATTEALIDSFGEKSIVVLPFVNMSDDQDTEYFSDGITEEMLNLLAKIPELRVISRSTSFVFKGQSVSATDVAKQLGVTYVLEGSVRRAGPLVRITAQLIDGRVIRTCGPTHSTRNSSWTRSLSFRTKLPSSSHPISRSPCLSANLNWSTPSHTTPHRKFDISGRC